MFQCASPGHWPPPLRRKPPMSSNLYITSVPVFQASSTVQFDPNPPRPLGKNVEAVVEMGNGSYWNNREYYETQYKVIQSMRVALAVVRDLRVGRSVKRPGPLPVL